LAGGLNEYGFAAGDPITYSDPFGLWPEWVRAIGEELAGIPGTIRRNWDKLLGWRSPLDPTPHVEDIDRTPPPPDVRPAKEPGEAGDHGKEGENSGPRIETDEHGNITLHIPKPSGPSARIALDNIRALWHGLGRAIDDAARMNDRTLQGAGSNVPVPAVPPPTVGASFTP